MSFELSERLKNNAYYPWFVIVPEVESDIEELTQLSDSEYDAVMKLARRLSLWIKRHFGVEKGMARSGLGLF